MATKMPIQCLLTAYSACADSSCEPCEFSWSTEAKTVIVVPDVYNKSLHTSNFHNHSDSGSTIWNPVIPSRKNFAIHKSNFRSSERNNNNPNESRRYQRSS